MIITIAAIAVLQVQVAPPIRFIVSHRSVTDAERKLLSEPIDTLEKEAGKVSFVIRKQDDSIAIYAADLYDVHRVDRALKGQLALAEIIRRKQTKFSLGDLTGDDKEGLTELMKRGAQNIGTAALDPATQISVGFHYYVTIEANGKSIEDVISVVPPASASQEGTQKKSEPYVDASPPPDINSLSVIYDPKRTPSQRRTKALSDLMIYFGEIIKKQNETIGKTFAALEEAGSWEQTISKGMTTKGLDDPLKKSLLSSLSQSMERYGFKTKGDIERFLDGGKFSAVRRVPSLGATGVLNGKPRTAHFSATVNRGG